MDSQEFAAAFEVAFEVMGICDIPGHSIRCKRIED